MLQCKCERESFTGYFQKYIAKNAAKRIPCSVEGVERVRLEAESKGGVLFQEHRLKG